MGILGESPNFQLQVNPDLAKAQYTAAELQDLQRRAPALLAGFEADYATLCGWFGVAVGAGLGAKNRVIVSLGNMGGGAENYGYSQSNPPMSVSTLGGTDDSILSLFVEEMAEILMSYKFEDKWHPGYSDGEGLSRVAGDLLHPLSAADNVDGWLAFDPTMDVTSTVDDTQFRKDWVSMNFTGALDKQGSFINGDWDIYPIGCAMLFINYLRDQLGYSMSEIVQHGTGTLEGTYRSLSNATVSGFLQFKRLLDVHFPGPGLTCNSDNPFPLALTDVALASAGRRNNLFVFAKLLDGRIVFNQAAPGCAFVGWQEVPGGQRTDVALAVGMLHDTLFVFAKTSDGRIVFNQAAPGGAFVGWQEVPGGVVTNVPLASAGRQNNLFVFAKALDGRILFNQAAPGCAFVGWQEVPGGWRTDAALAAGMQHDTLFVFAKTSDGRMIFNQAAPGGAFVGWQEVPGGAVTYVPLACAGRQDNLFVFAKRPDGRIIFNQAAPGCAFVGWQEVPGGCRTDAALAAGMQHDTLFVFAKTSDGRMIFNQAAPGGAFVGWQLGR